MQRRGQGADRLAGIEGPFPTSRAFTVYRATIYASSTVKAAKYQEVTMVKMAAQT